jgi:hypothetical protein
MGLQNTKNNTYVQIIHGKFAVKCEENDPGATARTNKLGTVVFEKYANCVTGYLRNIQFRKDGGFGEQLMVTLQDDEDKESILIIQMPLFSKMARSFLYVSNKISPSVPVALEAWQSSKGGIKKSGLTVSQGQERLEPPFLVDDPATGKKKMDYTYLPAPEKVMVQGKEQWDYTKQARWLEEQVMKKVWPKLGVTAAPAAPAPAPVEDEDCAV